jgi:antitoxin (DNA-binding transcriptional repressor) of toxin-antitoxin stability system
MHSGNRGAALGQPTRNQSDEILRHVADGETIQVANHGQVAALIVPLGADPIGDLVSRGQLRVARHPTSNLRSIVRRKSTADSQAIVADVRGLASRPLETVTLLPAQTRRLRPGRTGISRRPVS